MKRRSLYDSFRLLRRAYPNVTEGLPVWEPAVCAMLRLPVEATEEEKHIALLQQLPQDTIIQTTDLARMGYSPRIVEAVTQLSPRAGESLADRTSRILATNDPSLIRIEHANQSESAARAETPQEAAAFQTTIAQLAIRQPPGTPHVPSLRHTLKFIQEAHGDQKYNGRPYWIHPLSVMFRMPHQTSGDALHAGMLHDVIEDTDRTEGDLEARGYSNRTIWLVKLLTKQKLADGTSESSLSQVQRVLASNDAEAIRLKHSDMSENLAYPDEISAEKRAKLLKKYAQPMRLLTEAVNRLDAPARSR